MNDPQPARAPRDPSTQIHDRRRGDRIPTEASIQVELDAQSLAGRCENLSHAGVLFFSPNHLNVTVHIDTGTGRRTLTGRIARVERMSAENAGYAIEFDVA